MGNETSIEKEKRWIDYQYGVDEQEHGQFTADFNYRQRMENLEKEKKKQEQEDREREERRLESERIENERREKRRQDLIAQGINPDREEKLCSFRVQIIVGLIGLIIAFIIMFEFIFPLIKKK